MHLVGQIIHSLLFRERQEFQRHPVPMDPQDRAHSQKATSANDIAILTVTSDGESKQSLIATYQIIIPMIFFQCF